MELMIFVKNNKYTVEDKKQRRLYTVKKKGLGGSRFALHDASNYQLYTFVQTSEDRKPTFTILHNDATYMRGLCKSLFLDPTIEFKGKDGEYELVSKDHKNFDFMTGGKKAGELHTAVSVSGDLQYTFQIEDKIFDDYMVLFAVAVDRTFGEMNKEG